MYGMWWKDEPHYHHNVAQVESDYYDDVYDYTPLLFAVHGGDLKRFKALLDKRHLEYNICDKKMLHIASARGHLEIVKILIKIGENVNEQDLDESTPLILALAKNHVEIAEILLQNGADVNVVDYEGRTPLQLAIDLKNIHLVETILKKGANVNVMNDNEYMFPIQIAAELNDNQFVEMFLKHGAKIDPIVEDYGGRENGIRKMTPLHYAAQNGNLEMVELLMKNGFDTLDIRNDKGETPLFLAVKKNHLNVVKYLFENDSKSVSEIVDVNCLLDLCKTNEHLEILKYLIDLGIKCKLQTGADSLLHSSLSSGELEIWKYLLTCLSKIDLNLSSRESELHSAIRAGQVDIVKEIINKQTGKVKSLSRKLAVFIAVEIRNEEVLKPLLKAGSSFQSCFQSKLSPLHVAATFEQTRFVEILLKVGAKVNSKTTNGVTPLDFAAAAGRLNNVKFLLDAATDVSNLSRFASSALEYALKRRPGKEDEGNLTLTMFQNLLKITETLLIAGAYKMKDQCYYDNLLNFAINLRVSSENEPSLSCFNLKQESNEENKETNNKKGKFQPEIVRCLLNYLQEDKLNDSLNSILIRNSKQHTPDVLDVILEYYVSKSQIKLSHLNRQYWSNLLIIDQIEDVDNLLNVTQNHNLRKDSDKDEWTDLLRMITARLELLPSDQQTEKRKFDFYKNYKLLMCQNECQEQIKSLQVIKPVEELNVTFYDILIKPVDKVARYIRVKSLLNSLESSSEEFPAYAKFLEMRVENGKQRNSLNNMCVNGMFYFIKKNYKIQFSSEDIEEILQYLSVIDLRRLSAACSSLFPL